MPSSSGRGTPPEAFGAIEAGSRTYLDAVGAVPEPSLFSGSKRAQPPAGMSCLQQGPRRLDNHHRAVVGEQPWPDEASTLSLPRQRPREFRMPVPQPWWRRIRSRFFVDRTRALA